MYADAVARIVESIFPIFYVLERDDQVLAGVSGTGFFVGSDGLFVTAHHVISGAPAGSTLYYYGQVPDRVCQPAVEIEHLASDPPHDLFLGRIRGDALPPVELAREAVRVGDAVCLAGYPMAAVATAPEGRLIGNIRRYWQPTFVIDLAQAVIDHRLYDGYLVQHTCLPGMSGGPAFDVHGRVHGMAVATLARPIPEPGGTSTIVANGVVIDAEHIRRFIEAAGARPHGTDHPLQQEGPSRCAPVAPTPPTPPTPRIDTMENHQFVRNRRSLAEGQPTCRQQQHLAG